MAGGDKKPTPKVPNIGITPTDMLGRVIQDNAAKIKAAGGNAPAPSPLDIVNGLAPVDSGWAQIPEHLRAGMLNSEAGKKGVAATNTFNDQLAARQAKDKVAAFNIAAVNSQLLSGGFNLAKEDPRAAVLKSIALSNPGTDAYGQYQQAKADYAQRKQYDAAREQYARDMTATLYPNSTDEQIKTLHAQFGNDWEKEQAAYRKQVEAQKVALASKWDDKDFERDADVAAVRKLLSTYTSQRSIKLEDWDGQEQVKGWKPADKDGNIYSFGAMDMSWLTDPKQRGKLKAEVIARAEGKPENFTAALRGIATDKAYAYERQKTHQQHVAEGQEESPLPVTANFFYKIARAGMSIVNLVEGIKAGLTTGVANGAYNDHDTEGFDVITDGLSEMKKAFVKRYAQLENQTQVKAPEFKHSAIGQFESRNLLKEGETGQQLYNAWASVTGVIGEQIPNIIFGGQSTLGKSIVGKIAKSTIAKKIAGQQAVKWVMEGAVGKVAQRAMTNYVSNVATTLRGSFPVIFQKYWADAEQRGLFKRADGTTDYEALSAWAGKRAVFNAGIESVFAAPWHSRGIGGGIGGAINTVANGMTKKQMFKAVAGNSFKNGTTEFSEEFGGNMRDLYADHAEAQEFFDNPDGYHGVYHRYIESKGFKKGEPFNTGKALQPSIDEGIIGFLSGALTGVASLSAFKMHNSQAHALGKLMENKERTFKSLDRMAKKGDMTPEKAAWMKDFLGGLEEHYEGAKQEGMDSHLAARKAVLVAREVLLSHKLEAELAKGEKGDGKRQAEILAQMRQAHTETAQIESGTYRKGDIVSPAEIETMGNNPYTTLRPVQQLSIAKQAGYRVIEADRGLLATLADDARVQEALKNFDENIAEANPRLTPVIIDEDGAVVDGAYEVARILKSGQDQTVTVATPITAQEGVEAVVEQQAREEGKTMEQWLEEAKAKSAAVQAAKAEAEAAEAERKANDPVENLKNSGLEMDEGGWLNMLQSRRKNSTQGALDEGSQGRGTSISATQALDALNQAGKHFHLSGGEAIIGGTWDGDFRGAGGATLEMDTNGNVVLRRGAMDEAALTKRGLSFTSTADLYDTSLTNGAGNGIPTASNSVLGDTYNYRGGEGFAQGVFRIPVAEFIKLANEGHIVLGNIGESEVVISPEVASKYLSEIDGKPTSTKQNVAPAPESATPQPTPAAASIWEAQGEGWKVADEDETETTPATEAPTQAPAGKGKGRKKSKKKETVTEQAATAKKQEQMEQAKSEGGTKPLEAMMTHIRGLVPVKIFNKGKDSEFTAPDLSDKGLAVRIAASLAKHYGHMFPGMGQDAWLGVVKASFDKLVGEAKAEAQARAEKATDAKDAETVAKQALAEEQEANAADEQRQIKEREKLDAATEAIIFGYAPEGHDDQRTFGEWLSQSGEKTEAEWLAARQGQQGRPEPAEAAATEPQQPQGNERSFGEWLSNPKPAPATTDARTAAINPFTDGEGNGVTTPSVKPATEAPAAAEEAPAPPVKNTPPAPKKQTEKKEKLSGAVAEVALADITTDEGRFQNRDGLDEERVQNIVENYDANKLDPIVVYPEGDGYVVLSGHHRFEAMRRLGMASIPVRIFEGTEQEAKDLALDSNTLGKQETPTERAARYRKMREEGVSEAEILRLARLAHGSDAVMIVNLSRLTPNSKAVEAIRQFENSTDTDTKNKVRAIGDWIGQLTGKHPLSATQQNSAFDYLMGAYSRTKGAGKITNKAQFIDVAGHLIERLKANGKFDGGTALPFDNAMGKSSVELAYDEAVATAKAEYEAAIKEVNARRAEFVERGATPEQMEAAMRPYDQTAQRKYKDYQDVLAMKGQVRQATEQMGSLFDNFETKNTDDNADTQSVANSLLGTETTVDGSDAGSAGQSTEPDSGTATEPTADTNASDSAAGNAEPVAEAAPVVKRATGTQAGDANITDIAEALMDVDEETKNALADLIPVQSAEDFAAAVGNDDAATPQDKVFIEYQLAQEKKGAINTADSAFNEGIEVLKSSAFFGPLQWQTKDGVVRVSHINDRSTGRLTPRYYEITYNGEVVFRTDSYATAVNYTSDHLNGVPIPKNKNPDGLVYRHGYTQRQQAGKGKTIEDHIAGSYREAVRENKNPELVRAVARALGLNRTTHRAVAEAAPVVKRAALKDRIRTAIIGRTARRNWNPAAVKSLERALKVLFAKGKGFKDVTLKVMDAEAFTEYVQQQGGGGGNLATTKGVLISGTNAKGEKIAEIVINASTASPTTVLHEAGHLWKRWAYYNARTLHDKGMKLAGESPLAKMTLAMSAVVGEQEVGESDADYKARMQAAILEVAGKHPDAVAALKKAYGKDWEEMLWTWASYAEDAAGMTPAKAKEMIADEVLAHAIESEGKIMNAPTFSLWLRQFWDAVREAFGKGNKTFKQMSAKEFANLSLEDFAAAVTKELTDTPSIDEDVDVADYYDSTLSSEEELDVIKGIRTDPQQQFNKLRAAVASAGRGTALEQRMIAEKIAAQMDEASRGILADAMPEGRSATMIRNGKGDALLVNTIAQGLAEPGSTLGQAVTYLQKEAGLDENVFTDEDIFEYVIGAIGNPTLSGLLRETVGESGLKKGSVPSGVLGDMFQQMQALMQQQLRRDVTLADVKATLTNYAQRAAEAATVRDTSVRADGEKDMRKAENQSADKSIAKAAEREALSYAKMSPKEVVDSVAKEGVRVGAMFSEVPQDEAAEWLESADMQRAEFAQRLSRLVADGKIKQGVADSALASVDAGIKDLREAATREANAKNDSGYDYDSTFSYSRGTTIMGMPIQGALFTDADFDTAGEVKPDALAEIEAERNAIKAQAQADGTWMKAPNGQPTNLSEGQWVDVRTRRFKDWFGDWQIDPANASKVVDENGEPMVVYHGTGAKFNTFDTKESTRANPVTEQVKVVSAPTFFFTDSEKAAAHVAAVRARETMEVKPVFLNAKFPIVVADFVDISEYTTDSEQQFEEEGKQFWEYFDQPDFVRKFSEDFDAATFEDHNIDGTTYALFSPNQIKSATANTGEYSSDNNDIRFSRSGKLFGSKEGYTPSQYEQDLAASLEGLRAAQSQVTRMQGALTRAEQKGAPKGLTALVRRLVAGATEGDLTEAKAALADARKKHQETKRVLRSQLGLERGANWITEKLSRAAREGAISQEAADLAIDLVRANPALYEDLAISIVTSKKDDGVSGYYNAAEMLVRVFKEGSKVTTATHELLHHGERFLPEAMQEKIADEWVAGVEKELKALAGIDTSDMTEAEKEQYTRTQLYLALALEAHTAASEADRIATHNLMVKLFTGAPLVEGGQTAAPMGNDYYQYFNASEWWAENASRLFKERADKAAAMKDAGWLDKVGEFFRGLVAGAKRIFGMDATRQVEKGLDMVLSGKGLETEARENMSGMNQNAFRPGTVAKNIINAGKTKVKTAADNARDKKNSNHGVRRIYNLFKADKIGSGEVGRAIHQVKEKVDALGMSLNKADIAFIEEQMDAKAAWLRANPNSNEAKHPEMFAKIMYLAITDGKYKRPDGTVVSARSQLSPEMQAIAIRFSNYAQMVQTRTMVLPGFPRNLEKSFLAALANGAAHLSRHYDAHKQRTGLRGAWDKAFGAEKKRDAAATDAAVRAGIAAGWPEHISPDLKSRGRKLFKLPRKMQRLLKDGYTKSSPEYQALEAQHNKQLKDPAYQQEVAEYKAKEEEIMRDFLREILNPELFADKMLYGAKGNKVKMSEFKKRKDLPAWLREYLGEEMNAESAFILTLRKNTDLVKHLIYLNEVRGIGLSSGMIVPPGASHPDNYIHVGPQEFRQQSQSDKNLKKHGKEQPDELNRWGQLQDHWMHPDMYDAVFGKGAANPFAMEQLGFFGLLGQGYQKTSARITYGKIVLNATSAFTNLIGNKAFLQLNGTWQMMAQAAIRGVMDKHNTFKAGLRYYNDVAPRPLYGDKWDKKNGALGYWNGLIRDARAAGAAESTTEAALNVAFKELSTNELWRAAQERMNYGDQYRFWQALDSKTKEGRALAEDIFFRGTGRQLYDAAGKLNKAAADLFKWADIIPKLMVFETTRNHMAYKSGLRLDKSGNVSANGERVADFYALPEGLKGVFNRMAAEEVNQAMAGNTRQMQIAKVIRAISPTRGQIGSNFMLEAIRVFHHRILIATGKRQTLTALQFPEITGDQNADAEIRRRLNKDGRMRSAIGLASWMGATQMLLALGKAGLIAVGAMDDADDDEKNNTTDIIPGLLASPKAYAWYEAISRINGSSNMRDLIEAIVPEYDRNQPVRYKLEDGKLTVWQQKNQDAFSIFGILGRGFINEGFWEGSKSAAEELVMPVVGLDLFTKTLWEMAWNRDDRDRKIWLESDTDGEALAKMRDYFIQKDKPGLFTTTDQMKRDMDKGESFGDAAMTQALKPIMGRRNVYVLTEKAGALASNRARQWSDQQRAFRWEWRKADDEGQDAVVARAFAKKKQIALNLFSDMELLRVAGVSGKQIEAALREAGVRADVRNAVLSGNMDKLRPVEFEEETD